jgi:hypothetical protein
MTGSAGMDDTIFLAVVKPDATETYQYLEATLAPTLGRGLRLLGDRRRRERRGPVDAGRVERRVWDRRAPEDPDPAGLDPRLSLGDRRQQLDPARMPERRQVERRRRAPETWPTLGFVLVRMDRPPVP